MSQSSLRSPQDELTVVQGPAFPDGLPFVRPSVPEADVIASDLRRVLQSGVLTNGPFVAELERRTADYLGVRHCVAVASGTTGLMLVLRASGLSGDVVLPSFTFSATAHAVAWNGLRPVFADVDPKTLTLSASSALHAMAVRTSAILATHIYGTPCDVEALTELARQMGIRLFFDAAHAFGSRHRGVPVGGFGDAEVFSLSPTKTLVAGEGGIIATNDDILAERCRLGRDYGKDGTYDCRIIGLNARMSEIHAAMALASLNDIEDRIRRRNAVATSYKEALRHVTGISFPEVPDGDASTFKDFSILVDPDEFGCDSATLAVKLAADGIETRRYYAPPVHSMRTYKALSGSNGHLPETDRAASQVLTLPLWAEMSGRDVLGVAGAISGVSRGLQQRSRGGPEKIRHMADDHLDVDPYAGVTVEKERPT